MIRVLQFNYSGLGLEFRWDLCSTDATSLVMGTKVQYKSYFSERSMRGLNEDAESGHWSLFYGDKMMVHPQHYNGFLPRPSANEHADYDKEMLRQTMLKHEAIFRNQVNELHRLYRIQRDLMEEFNRKELQKYPAAMEVSHSIYPSSSQMPSVYGRNMAHISSVPFMNSACSKPSKSGTDNRQSPLSYVKESNMQVERVLMQNDSFKCNTLLESNSAKLPRRMFDLQLPADEYIDTEEGEQEEVKKVSQTSTIASYPPARNSGAALDTIVNLSLGSGGDPKYRGDVSSSDSCLLNKHNLADLNQPIQVEEAASSTPPTNNILGSVTYNGGARGHYLPVKQNSESIGFHRDLFHRAHTDNKIDINALHSENAGRRREWQFHNLEAGQRGRSSSFSQGFSREEFRTTTGPCQADFEGAHLPAFLLDDKSKREPWKGSVFCETEISKRSPSFSNCRFPRTAELPLIHSPYPVVPDVADSTPSFHSSWKKPMTRSIQNQLAVQALPCFNNSSQSGSKNHKTPIQNQGLIEDQWQPNIHLGSNSSYGSELTYRNGFCNGPQFESNASKVSMASAGSDYANCRNNYTSTSEQFESRTTKYFKGSNCMDIKSAKDINLNLAIPNVLVEGKAPERDVVIIDGEGMNEDAERGLPWLRIKSVQNSGPVKEREASNDVGFDLMKRFTLKEKVPTQGFMWDTASTSRARVMEERTETDNCSNIKKILGFPIFDNPHIPKEASSHSSSKSQQNRSEVGATDNIGKVGVLNFNLSCDPAVPDSNQKQSTENLVVAHAPGFKNQFNLNSCAEEEPISCIVPRVKLNIDLEAPVAPESADDMCLEEELRDDTLETPVRSSQIELQDPSGKLDRIVAETIVSISSSRVQDRSVDVMCHPLETTLCESLCWFADVVSSCTNDLGSRGKSIGYGGESDSDGSDYFEMMTLKLTETKEDEYFRPWEPETPKEEDESVVPSVPTRRRRGQARRGRQRRDFQRDILPGLTSLSRHEVTADLQTIGGLMKATGQIWESGLARRNGARNGWGRGRRRARNPPATVVCSPPRQEPDTIEPVAEERSLKGWGKTTRRPRRQRVAIGNAPL